MRKVLEVTCASLAALCLAGVFLLEYMALAGCR